MTDAMTAVAANDALAIRQAFERDGFVLLRQILDPERLAAARAALVGPLERAGWIIPPDADGVIRPEPRLTTPDLYRERLVFDRVFGAEELHLLGRDSALTDAVGAIVGSDDLLVHPNPAIRVIFPDDRSTADVTPAHQDLAGMQGSPKTVTAWVTLCSCPIALGPIEVASGSHRSGLRPIVTRPGSRVLPCDDTGLADFWRRADLDAGDVVLFHALAVHRTPPNRSGAVRLSVDFRYQPQREPISEVSVRPPAGLTWEEIRAGWHDPALRAGLDESELDVVPFDPRFAFSTES